MDHKPGRFLSALAAFSVRRARWVIAFWLLAVVAINVLVPQLEAVIAKDSTPVAPADAPGTVALARMDETFGTGGSTSFVFVVLERDGGLTPADQRFARHLVPVLRHDREHVSFVQDIVRRPELVRALTSRDGEAMYLQVGLPGATGAPSAIQQIEAVRDLTEAGRPDGLNVAVTGPPATISDMATEVEHSILLITAATVVLIGIILLLIYRSIAVMALVLGMIGVALALSRGLAAALGSHVFSVSTFTGSFLTAVVLGAATDYAVFLISRYQELRRDGVDPTEAAAEATARVSGVIIGSALTVAVANGAMALADVGIFRTTGPAIAFAVAGTLALALTLMPAVVATAGRRGLLDPRSATANGGWARLAAIVVARPGRVLAAGLIPLLLLASFYPLMVVSFDERGHQPDDTPSNEGYRLLADHFPLNEVLPDFVLVSADHDLRNARDLAALEQAAGSIARTPGVVSVRGVTRPLGTTIREASVGYQAGVVGHRLVKANDRLATGAEGAQQLADGSRRLDDGAHQLADGAGQLADGADRAVAGAGTLLSGLDRLRNGLDRLVAGSGQTESGSRRLRTGAGALADGLDTAYDQTKVAVDGLGMAYQALQSAPGCLVDPICQRARDGVRQVWVGERDQLLPGLRRAADGARALADGSGDLAGALAQIGSGLQQARSGAQQLRAGQQTMKDRLGDLAGGADQVAGGADRVAGATGQVEGGTAQMAESVTDLQAGLARAATYLRRTGAATNDPALGGFYLPPAAFQDPRMAMASGLYLSRDGHTARFFVLGDSDAFQAEAMERTVDIRDAAENGLSGTRLEGSEVAITGVASINGDLQEFSQRDFRFVALVALIAVLLILIVLLRSLLAPLFLLASVALSYAAAMGLGVLVWQVLLDNPLDWSVPAIAFILLVAVGADYNLLLMKRMQEDAPAGEREGIARSVTMTGGVITAAGVIFAASMGAMMTGSVTTLAQIGFTIGLGLLLDTFVVRTLVIPALATLLGRHLWWPRRVRGESVA